MKEDSMFKQFFMGFLKAVSIIILLVTVGFGSYQITMYYYKTVEDYAPVKTTTIVKDIVTDASADEVAQNLIYSVNEETGEITQIVLEIFNTYTSNLDYISIPVNTQFAISNTMYQRVVGVNPEVPQIIKLSEIGTYFEEESMYAYGMVTLEDFLGIDISFYTVIPSSQYNTMFESVSMEMLGQEDEVAHKMEIQQLSAAFKAELAGLKDEEARKDYMTSYYDKIQSNLSLKKRLKYIPNYQSVNLEFVYYHGIAGQEKKTNYEIDSEAAKQQIEAIRGNETYLVAQKTTTTKDETVSSSKGLVIQILNGSNISGLGSRYKQKLSAAGYTILAVGNYTQAVLTNTKIIVKTDGVGLDLVEYFNGAELEVGQVEAGIDIQIILGTVDDSIE